MSDEQKRPGTGAGLGPTTSDAVRALMGKAAIQSEKKLSESFKPADAKPVPVIEQMATPQPAAAASAPRAVAAKAKPSLAASKTMKVVWNLPISSVFKVKAHAQIDDRTISDLMAEIINFYYANHPDKTL